MPLCPAGHDDWYPSKKCRPCTKARNKRVMATPLGKLKRSIYDRRAYLKNPEKKLEMNRRWKKQHPDLQLAYGRKWYYSRRGVDFWVKEAKESL